MWRTAQLLTWLLGSVLAGCGGQELVLELRHPPSFDPAALPGPLTVSLTEADGTQPLQTTQLTASRLSSRQVLFSGLKLKTGQRYRIAVRSEAASSCGGGQAQGQSPLFTFGEDLGRLAVYFDCADTSSATASPQDVRQLSAAVWLPDPAPHGQVVIAGGAQLTQSDATPGLSLNTPLLASLESYDPARGSFTLLPARLSSPRAGLQGASVGSDRAVFAGGLVRGLLGLTGSPLVEQLHGDQLTTLPSLRAARGLSQAITLGDQWLLVGGLGEKTTDYLTTAELYSLTTPATPRSTLSMSAGRVLPALAALDDKRAMVVGGSADASQELPSDLVCLEGCDGACPGSCLLREPGFPTGSARTALAGVQVPCEGQARGAVYVFGGSLRKSLLETEVFDEIYCIDPGRPEVMTLVGHLITPRSLPTAVLVRGPSGQRIFVAGGYYQAPLATGELIPASCSCPAADSLGKNSPAPSRIALVQLAAGRFLHNAVPLPDGTVLLVGGQVGARSAERFNPAF